MKPPIHAILLAGRGVPHTQTFGPQTTSRFSTSLEWILNALRSNNIKHIHIIGGKDTEAIGKEHSDVHFLFNPDWEKTGPIDSLLCAADIVKNHACIVSYVDIVYRPEFLKKIVKLKSPQPVAIIDTKWKSRYPRSEESVKKAEKILTDKKGFVQNAGRAIKETSGEYAGIFYIPRETGGKVIDICIGQKKSGGKTDKGRGGMMDLFNSLRNEGLPVRAMTASSGWAELDEPMDFRRFVFGTKSQTLERLQPILKNGVILPQCTFTVRDWRENAAQVLQEIRVTFPTSQVIVRSSTLVEDAIDASHAGEFASVPAVDTGNSAALRRAVSKVSQSFLKHMHEGNQILIQPFIRNVAASGVVLTCDLKTGAPYYTVNYDTSGSTSSVTAGESHAELWHIRKKSVNAVKDPTLKKILRCAEELERLTGNDAIDIEFAIDKKGRLFIFQVRPITSQNTLVNYRRFDIAPVMEKTKKTIIKQLKRKPHLAGKTTVLGDMPDWNPAELIGSQPRPLASSLFDTLIMHDAWRRARTLLGYFDTAPEHLMVMLAGHPYIDVRSSLNSYTPAGMPQKLREKLVNESLDYLTSHPDTHDKLEFEVATTCFSPLAIRRKKRWKEAGFSPSDCDSILESLLMHTNEILTGTFPTITELRRKVGTLDERRRKILFGNHSHGERVKSLLDDCIEYGTIPFSALARLAFIAQTFLRSAEQEGALNKEAVSLCMQSVHTVLSDMGNHLHKVQTGAMERSEFLKLYGHLRPGTFDITSPRYDAAPDLYFHAGHSKHTKSPRHAIWQPTTKEKEAIEKMLKNTGIKQSATEFFTFIKGSIAGREEAKFLFSKNVSDILETIATWGEMHELSREELSFLDISSFLRCASMRGKSEAGEKARSIIKKARVEYELHQQVIMPQLIFKPDDAECVRIREGRPNFITMKRVNGHVMLVENLRAKKSVDGKIVFIESADPGYDWIFTHDILGLVTKYGGAGSHMAIRCAEFGIPAAIGAGHRFDVLKSQAMITLDAANQSLSA